MQDNYLNLPSRNSTQHKYTVLTNLYEIRMEKLPNKYYLYTPKPDVDQHTFKLLKKYVKQSKVQSNSFYQQIGFISYYQKGFLGNTNLNSTFTLQFNEITQNNKVITVVMAKPKEVSLNQLISSHKGIRFIRSTLSTPVASIMSNKHTKVTLHKHKQFIFETMRKISLSYVYFNHKIWISTDTTNRVQEHCTILEYISKYSGIESGVLLKGAKIVKNYGKMEELYLLEVDCTKNPTHQIDDRSKLTFEQYYLQKYKITIKNKQQPLIKATRKNKLHPHPSTQYLIPELVSLADKSYMPDCPQHLPTQIKQLKNITPHQKEESISQIIGQLGTQDIIKKSAINLDAKQLTAPYILTKNRETLPEDGLFEFRNAIRQSPELKSWAIAYSTGSSNEKQEVEQLIDYFRNLTRIYAVNITSNPSSIMIKDKKWQSWQAGLQQNFKNYGKVQIILLFLKEQQEQHYYKLKEYLTLKIQCPSQIICKKNFQKQKCRKPYAIAIDALLQIITKIGAIPWDLIRQQNAISQSLVMQGGLTINKDINGFNFGLVGAAGKQLNEVSSHFKKNLKTKEDLKNELQNCLILWAKSFVVGCRSAPQTIILYTHTFSQANLKEIRQIQETAFFSLAAKIGHKIKQQNYSANMALINVSTRQKIQFYSKELMTSDFILKNVNTGTVVYEQTSSPSSYNFYLASKTATCTTAKPVKYEVVCNNQNLKREQLSQFTYESCYCYFNYQGAHSIPGMLQNSVKLSKLWSKFTTEAKVEERMSRLQYYL